MGRFGPPAERTGKNLTQRAQRTQRAERQVEGEATWLWKNNVYATDVTAIMRQARHDRISLPYAVSCLLPFLLIGKVCAQEWTRFRGPNGSGISHAKTIPSKITDADLN